MQTAPPASAPGLPPGSQLPRSPCPRLPAPRSGVQDTPPPCAAPRRGRGTDTRTCRTDTRTHGMGTRTHRMGTRTLWKDTWTPARRTHGPVAGWEWVPPSRRDLCPPLGTARTPLALSRDESPGASLLQTTDEMMLKTRAAAGGGGTGRAGRRGHGRHTKASSSAMLSSLLRRPARGAASPPLLPHPFSFPLSAPALTPSTASPGWPGPWLGPRRPGGSWRPRPGCGRPSASAACTPRSAR